MAVFKKGYVKLLFLLFVLLSAALVFLNLFLNHKLGSEGPAYVDEFARELSYDLSYDSASFDPLFRLRINGLSMLSPDGGKPYAEIGSVRISPSIISSILGRRISIGDVYVEQPVVRYDAEAADRLVNLFKGDGDGKGKGGVSVEVEHVRIRDAAFEISPDFTLTSKSMNVLIVKRSGETDYDEINAAGDINIQGVDTEITGSVNLRKDATDGKLVITAGKLSGIPLPDEDGAEPADVSARAEIEFRAAATAVSSGTVTLSGDGKEDTPRLAELGYALDFDRDADTVSFEKLDFDVLGVLAGNFTGEIKDVTGDTVFDLSGSSGEGDISNIVKRLPWLDAEKISGTAKAEDLKVTGSIKRDALKLTGKLLVDNAGFEYGDGSLDIQGLDCTLDISQTLQPPFTQRSTGKCTAETAVSNAAGEVKDISMSVSTGARESFGATEIELADLNAKYLGGSVSGTAGLLVSDGKSRLSGKINGSDLDVSQIPEGLIPFDIGGRAESLSADFKGEGGEYGADVSFAVNDLEINLGEGRDFKLSRAATSAPVRIEYSAGHREDGASEPYGRISVNDKELVYEKLSFSDFFIESGRMEDLGFTIDLGGDWALQMTSRGSGFRVLGMDVALGKFREHLVIDKSGREGFSGNIEGSDGVFNGIELPSVSARYEYDSDSIDIRDVKAKIEDIGVFDVEKAGVLFGKDKGGYPYEITFSGGILSALNDRIKSERMTGRFTILDSSKNERGWEGVINSPATAVASETIENLAMNIGPLTEGVSVSGISGRLRGGDLGGKVDILTSGERTRLSVNMALNNALIKSGSREIAMRWARINYSGLLTPGSLPEGMGKIDVSGLAVPDGAGGKVLLQAGVDAATSGETLLVREGFIRDSEGISVNVRGEMENILSGPVKTELLMQNVSLKSLFRLLTPFMPPSVGEAKLDGSAAVSAEFVNLFSPDMLWKGNITFWNASYSGYMGGALLTVRGINGALTIKDSGTAENPLAAFLDTGLELNKDVYRKYHKSLRDTPAGDTFDHLRIDEINYGILKFQDIQCELEADNDKLTIVRLVSDFFGGKLYGTGLFDYGGGEGAYNFSFLFNDISLEGISKRLSPTQEYITGRVNGLIWLDGEGGDTGTVNGPFEFWVVSSPKEQRTIGKALLDQLGAKERLILGSNRSYDTGEISGYINDGVITFKKFEISNSFLGFKNLSIQADPIKNSISISHLVSVIREIARRSQSGGPMIETN